MSKSINDFIKASIEMALHNECDFDFGDELMDELEENKTRITIKES